MVGSLGCCAGRQGLFPGACVCGAGIVRLFAAWNTAQRVTCNRHGFGFGGDRTRQPVLPRARGVSGSLRGCSVLVLVFGCVLHMGWHTV